MRHVVDPHHVGLRQVELSLLGRYAQSSRSCIIWVYSTQSDMLPISVAHEAMIASPSAFWRGLGRPPGGAGCRQSRSPRDRIFALTGVHP